MKLNKNSYHRYFLHYLLYYVTNTFHRNILILRKYKTSYLFCYTFANHFKSANYLSFFTIVQVTIDFCTRFLMVAKKP